MPQERRSANGFTGISNGVFASIEWGVWTPRVSAAPSAAPGGFGGLKAELLPFQPHGCTA